MSIVKRLSRYFRATYLRFKIKALRYQPLPSSLYRKNRTRLLSKLKPDSAVVIHSNDQFPVNADATHRFKQNSDLFYLTGIDQEETTLILAPNHPDPKFREMLFVKETNDMIATWEGKKLSKLEALQRAAVANIRWSHEFEGILNQVLLESQEVYLYQNEAGRSINSIKTSNDRFIEQCQANYPLHRYNRLAPLLYDLRREKQEEEIVAIQKAISITKKGFDNVVDAMPPGIKEYELEALFAKSFIEEGSRGFAYEPIIAGGQNSCVLHYIENDQVLEDGQLVLMDIGAEYGNYNADITRTFPVNGKFTTRQRDVYEAVLAAKNYATSLLKPGLLLSDYQKQVGAFIEQDLIKLGLLKQDEVDQQSETSPLYKRYFMHGTSHFLGLDVHDVGSRYQPLQVGDLLTVEPGIYIKDEGIGIRLEDIILIGENGNTILSEDIPITPDDIENWMSGH